MTTPPRLEFLADAEITLGPVQELGMTPAGRHEHLNNAIIIATAIRLPNAVRYAAYRVR